MREPKNWGATARRVRSSEDWGAGRPVSEPSAVPIALGEVLTAEEWQSHSVASIGALAGRFIERVPHLDLDPLPPLRPGKVFKVTAYVNKKPARPGEEIENVIAPSGARIEVDLVVTEHFRIKGNATAFLELKEEKERCAARPFLLAVSSTNKIVSIGTPTILAKFFYEGRPCGRIARAIDIVGIASHSPSRPPLSPNDDAVQIEFDAKPADLTITVEAPDSSERRIFSCKVQSPLLKGRYKKGIRKPWKLPDTTDTIMRGYMDLFTSANTISQRVIDELSGVGRELFKCSPAHFRETFWKLIDTGKPLRHIAIISQEPFIPWELMIPHRMKNGEEEALPPLGVQFCVGRWTPSNGISARQKVLVRDSFVIAPKYSEGRELKFAQAEASLVLSTLKGDLIDPSKYENIRRRLTEGRTLVHIVCHGEDGGNGVQLLDLEDDEQLSSAGLEGMADIRSVFKKKKPFVFLNACEVGRGAPALVGLGGFAKSFIDIGASAVIAPLWVVNDRIAHEIAKEFYHALKTGRPLPFSEFMRNIREKAYKPGAEDTYAAYIFYGDPAATITGATAG
jgi:CHAT domain